MKSMYIPPVGWLETLLYGQVDDFTDMMTPRATGDDEHQYGSSWTDRSQERIDEMIEQHGSREEVLDRIEQGRIGFSADWKDDVLHYLNNPGGGSSSNGQDPNNAGSGGSGQGADYDEVYSGGGSQPSETQDRDDSPPGPPRRYRDDDDDGYSRRRPVSPPAVEPEPLRSAFATGEEGYAPEAIGALDTEERGGALGDGEERVLRQGMEDERRAFLAQERGSERQQASKERQEGAGQRDYLYDALWHSESTDGLTEEQFELLYAQLAGLRETNVSGDELYQAIGQSEVVSGMDEEQRDTFFRDVGAAQSSSAVAQDVEVGSFGAGSEIGPYVPERGDLMDRGRGPESGGIEQAEELLGEYAKPAGVEGGGLDPFDAGPRVPDPENLLDRSGSGRDIEGRADLGQFALETELGQLKAQGGGVWRRDPDTGDMEQVPDEEVERWMERPRVPDPENLLDRSGSGRDIEGRADLGQFALGTELEQLKAQGGGVWRRDPDTGDMEQVPDEEVERWMERPRVPDPENLLGRWGSGRDIEERVDLGRSVLETELGQLKAQGGGVWRRDPDTGDMEQVPDAEVERWMERPRVPDPENLLDRSGSGRDIEGRADLGQFALGTELEQLKAQGGGVWRRDPDTGDMEQVPDAEVERWMERPRVPDPENLLDRSGSGRDIEGRADLGRSVLGTELEQLKAQGGGVWRRDPDTGDMEQVPDAEVERWMERPRVPDPENLLDRWGRDEDEKVAAIRRILPDTPADSPWLTGTRDEVYEGWRRHLSHLRSNATHLAMRRGQLTSDQRRDKAHGLYQSAEVYRDFAREFETTDPAKAEEARRLASSLQAQGRSVIRRIDREAEVRANQPPEPERAGTVVTEEVAGNREMPTEIPAPLAFLLSSQGSQWVRDNPEAGTVPRSVMEAWAEEQEIDPNSKVPINPDGSLPAEYRGAPQMPTAEIRRALTPAEEVVLEGLQNDLDARMEGFAEQDKAWRTRWESWKNRGRPEDEAAALQAEHREVEATAAAAGPLLEDLRDQIRRASYKTREITTQLAAEVAIFDAAVAAAAGGVGVDSAGGGPPPGQVALPNADGTTTFVPADSPLAYLMSAAGRAWVEENPTGGTIPAETVRKWAQDQETTGPVAPAGPPVAPTSELEQLKAQGGGVWRRDPDTGDMERVPDEEVERWRERPRVPDPENLLGRGRGPESGVIEQAEDLLGEVGGDVSDAPRPPELRGSVEGSISSDDAGRRYLEENNLDGYKHVIRGTRAATIYDPDGLVAGVLSRNYDGSATVRPPSELERVMFRLPRGPAGDAEGRYEGAFLERAKNPILTGLPPGSYRNHQGEGELWTYKATGKPELSGQFTQGESRWVFAPDNPRAFRAYMEGQEWRGLPTFGEVPPAAPTTPAGSPPATSDGAPETGAEQYTVGDRATDRWEASMGVQSIEAEVGGSLDHGMIYLGRVNDPIVQREVLRDIKRDAFGDKEYTYTDYDDGSQKTTTVTAYLQDLYGLSPEAEADVSKDVVGQASPEQELGQLKAQGGGVWRRDLDTGDMEQVPDEEVERWMERPHVPDPENLLDRWGSGGDIEGRVEIGRSLLEQELGQLKAQGGGVWRRDPDTGDMEQVPDETGDMAPVPDEEVEDWGRRNRAAELVPGAASASGSYRGRETRRVRGEPVNEEAAEELATLEPERDRLRALFHPDEDQWDRDRDLWFRSGRPEDELQELNTRNRELHRRGAEIRQMGTRIGELRHPDYLVYTTPAAEPRLTPQPSDGAPETGAEQYTVEGRATDRWEASMGVQSIEDEVGGSLDHGMIYLGRVNDPKVQREVLRDIKRDAFGDKEYTYTDYDDGSQKTTTVTAYLQDLYGLSPEAEADVSKDVVGQASLEQELGQLKAQGGGVWRRDPDTGDMEQVPDEEVERWMDRPRVPDPENLLGRWGSGGDIEGRVEIGRSLLEQELGQLKAQGGGIWRRDPDTGDMEQVPDEEVERWMERPRVPDPENLLDRWGSGRDIEGRVDLGRSLLEQETQLTPADPFAGLVDPTAGYSPEIREALRDPEKGADYVRYNIDPGFTADISEDDLKKFVDSYNQAVEGYGASLADFTDRQKTEHEADAKSYAEAVAKWNESPGTEEDRQELVEWQGRVEASREALQDTAQRLQGQQAQFQGVQATANALGGEVWRRDAATVLGMSGSVTMAEVNAEIARVQAGGAPLGTAPMSQPSVDYEQHRETIRDQRSVVSDQWDDAANEEERLLEQMQKYERRSRRARFDPDNPARKAWDEARAKVSNLKQQSETLGLQLTLLDRDEERGIAQSLGVDPSLVKDYKGDSENPAYYVPGLLRRAERLGLSTNDPDELRQRLAETEAKSKTWYENRKPSGYDDDNEPYYLQTNPHGESFGLLRARIRDLEQGGNSVSEYVRKTSSRNARQEEINNKDDFGVGGGGAGGEAQAAIQRGLQELRNEGASAEELEAAGEALLGAVGDGSSEQQQQNIAKIKELTRGQVHTDTGGGYVQTDPNAIVTIGIDPQGNIVGSTTSREVPDTPWDTFLKEQEALLVTANAARRAGDPNNPIDQRAAAFDELKELAGPEGFSSAEFEAYASAGKLPDRLATESPNVSPGGPGRGTMPAEGGYDPEAAAAAQSWAADASALLESQGIDTSEMTDAQMAALVDPVAESAQRQHQRDVATWAADASALLESQDIDTSEMTDTQMAELVDPVAAAAQRQYQRDVATWAADASALLESQDIDTSEMTDAQMAELVDPVAAAAQRQHQRDVATWAADASALLESQGIDTSEMTDAQMEALVDPVAASAQRQHQRDVATWAADASALLESQGIDTSEMTDAQMEALVDPVAASAQRQHQRDVATWASDASALLESQGIDTSEMTDAQMAALVDPVAASAQRQHQRDVEAWKADASAWLESQGIDTSKMTDAQMAEMVDPAEMTVDRILDQIAGRMDAKDIGMLGSSYGLEGVQDYVSGVRVRRLDGETDAQYEARVQERNNPRSQDTPWWGGLWGASQKAGTTGYTIDPNDPRNANLLQQQAEGAKDWFRPRTTSDGTRETAQAWANRVVNQGDLDPEAVAMLGELLYPEGTNTGKTIADVQQTPGYGYGVNSRQTYDVPLELGRELTWSELAKREAGERKFGEGVITGAEIAATLVGTAGAFRAPMVARSVFGASARLGSGAARGFRGLSRIPGMGALRNPGAQNFAAKTADTVVQGVAEAGIDVALGVVTPLEPMQAMTPERIAQLTAFEVGAEAATNLARFASGRFGLTGLGDVAKVGFEDVPLTGWGGRTGVQRTAYIEGAIESNPSLADDFFVVRDETGRAVMVQPRTDVGRGLVAESEAFTRIRDGMASGMTDEGLARIARRAGIADPTSSSPGSRTWPIRDRLACFNSAAGPRSRLDPSAQALWLHRPQASQLRLPGPSLNPQRRPISQSRRNPECRLPTRRLVALFRLASPCSTVPTSRHRK